MSSSSQVDADAPNKGYELSGKIMLSAIVILFAVVIFMVCLHLYARWYLIRARRRQLQRRNRNRRQNIVFYVDSSTPAASRGLDSSVLKSLPVFVFDEAASNQKEVSECAVCLSEFEKGEKGRSLPKCKHSFHIDCIDMWFASHSTCPLCRAPVESIAEAESQNSDEVIQVVVVDSVAAETESGASLSPASELVPVVETSSFGDRRNAQFDFKGFSIEIPRRSDPTASGSSTDSPQAFKSPGGRMMSLRRILSRGLSMSSPSTVGVSGSGDCCELETGMREEPSLEPGRTQSSR
ncbi:unnamed protein product [Rhodiola kirilowii]